MDETTIERQVSPRPVRNIRCPEMARTLTLGRRIMRGSRRKEAQGRC
jgi:hypothetical protein